MSKHKSCRGIMILSWILFLLPRTICGSTQRIMVSSLPNPFGKPVWLAVKAARHTEAVVLHSVCSSVIVTAACPCHDLQPAVTAAAIAQLIFSRVYIIYIPNRIRMKMATQRLDPSLFARFISRWNGNLKMLRLIIHRVTHIANCQIIVSVVTVVSYVIISAVTIAL